MNSLILSINVVSSAIAALLSVSCSSAVLETHPVAGVRNDRTISHEALEHTAARPESEAPAVLPLPHEGLANILIDPPLAGPLANGRVVIPYRVENVRIVPVYGTEALDVSPRIGHIHVTVDDAPWHWLDASGQPLVITGLNPGKHKVMIELVNASHQTLDFDVTTFDVPLRSLTPPDRHADGFRSAPK